MEIDRDTFLENLFHILGFEAEKNVDKLRKPVDKDRWATEPAVVNAFYNPNKNDIGNLRKKDACLSQRVTSKNAHIQTPKCHFDMRCIRSIHEPHVVPTGEIVPKV